MRLFSRTLSIVKMRMFHKNVNNFVRLLAQQVAVPEHETLKGRIIHYLNIDSRDCEKELMEYGKLSNGEDLELVLNRLDDQFCMKLSRMNKREIFNLLNIYLSIVPHHITKFQFYKSAIKTVFDSLDRLDKQELMQFIFYIGLRKKHAEARTMLRALITQMESSFIESLTCEELCVICNSTFKTSTKIVNKELMERIVGFIQDNLFVLNDPQLFVTLLKTFRHNRCQNEDLLNTILETIFFNKCYGHYSFTMICHLLALYADHFFYDGRFKILIKQCMEELKRTKYDALKSAANQQLRGKDIKRFIWILSMFGEMSLVDSFDCKSIIVSKIHERIMGKEFEQDFESLIDLTLFLWMLNFRAYSILEYFIQNKSKLNLDKSSPSKLRLNLLLSAISIEDPILFQKLAKKPDPISTEYNLNYQLATRSQIKRVLECLNQIKSELGLSKFEFSQEIPHLNIVGITGFRSGIEKAVYIEVLDSYNILRNVAEDIPVGMMALKLRLLDQKEEGVLVLSDKEIKEMFDMELKEYLLDELKLIC